MFGLSGTEMLVIAVLALLLLGPRKLPDAARKLGKGMREFRRVTNEVRSSVEGEFYRMDQPVAPSAPPDREERIAHAAGDATRDPAA